MKKLIISFASIVLVCGCESGWNSIYRTVDMEGSGQDSVIVDAKQRVITNTSERGARIICAEPSPDVAQGISQSIEAALSAATADNTTLSGSAGYSSAAAVAQLGERLATIQLLRDELADLCRAYANGAVTQTHYTLRLSKLDDKMVTLLMGEMASGAFGRQLASTNGVAGGSVTGGASEETITAMNTEIAELVSQTETEKAEWDQSVQALAAANSAEDKSGVPAAQQSERTKYNDYIASKAKLDERRRQLRELQVGFATTSASANANVAGEIRNRDSGDRAEVAREISRLQQAYLDSDDLTVLLNACIAAMDSNGDDRSANDGSKNPENLLRETCSEELLANIQTALVGQQVRQTQLRALEAELDAEKEQSVLESRRIQLCLALLSAESPQPSVMTRCAGLIPANSGNELLP